MGWPPILPLCTGHIRRGHIPITDTFSADQQKRSNIMFGFGAKPQEQQTATCPCCQTPMQDMGAHGIRMGGVTGLGGAALGMIGGQIADDGEEAFEKKLKVQGNVRY
jgi:hypothetical protein